MPRTLASYVKKLGREPESSGAPSVPILLWEAPFWQHGQSDPGTSTAPGQPDRPHAGEPLVLEVRLRVAKSGGFADTIRLGRIDTNDVVIADMSISRFHAYFRQRKGTGEWLLADAGSKNGTWIGPYQLGNRKEHPLPDRARLRFGDVQVQFFLPPTFLEKLTELAREAASR
ncbi:MAG: FHA domain-containing protein [Myxococcales bacterium]|nr:FHA domain-containing protein [Myxococcales bacterium]